MIEWLQNLPKTMFVTIVIGAGILFIILMNPPRTVCDSQVQTFMASNADLLSSTPNKMTQKESRYKRLYDTCKGTNSPGGCLELFLSVRQLIKDTHTVDSKCFGAVKGQQAFNDAIWMTADLMAIMAWGSRPPLSPELKNGWLDVADLNLFCELKNTAINFYSQDTWNGFVEKYFKSLPGAESLDRNTAWSRMLFSANCNAF